MEERTAKFFQEYNRIFFERRLQDVKLIFSEKMKTSAGVYYLNKERICLNKKLLATRTEDEVKETLLHEMTHAYVHQKYGPLAKPHGKEFKEKIKEINDTLKLNIDTFHNFLSWWRCDGDCRFQSAHFYGYVSASDEAAVFDLRRKGVQIHKELCGGSFHKTTEPNPEMLLEFRRLKRKRQEKFEMKKCRESLGHIQCNRCKCDDTKIDSSQSKMIRYSTD